MPGRWARRGPSDAVQLLRRPGPGGPIARILPGGYHLSLLRRRRGSDRRPLHPVPWHGRIRGTSLLKVDVPPGVDSGMWLQLRNQGEPGDPGAPRGNLRIQIQVRKHPFFERRETTSFARCPSAFPRRRFGAEVEVPTLIGTERISFRVASRAVNSSKLKGRGMPDLEGRGRGDELIEVIVEVPKHLSPRQEEILRELAELEHENVSPRRKSFFEKLRDYFTEEAEPSDAALVKRTVRAGRPARALQGAHCGTTMRPERP